MKPSHFYWYFSQFIKCIQLRTLAALGVFITFMDHVDTLSQQFCVFNCLAVCQNNEKVCVVCVQSARQQKANTSEQRKHVLAYSDIIYVQIYYLSHFHLHSGREVPSGGCRYSSKTIFSNLNLDWVCIPLSDLIYWQNIHSELYFVNFCKFRNAEVRLYGWMKEENRLLHVSRTLVKTIFLQYSAKIASLLRL